MTGRVVKVSYLNNSFLIRANRHRFRSELVSLDAIDLGAGRVIITAADDDEVATESLHLGHGVFTHYLMDALQRPAGEANSDATIGLGTLYEQVATAVRRETEGASTR